MSMSIFIFMNMNMKVERERGHGRRRVHVQGHIWKKNFCYRISDSSDLELVNTGIDLNINIVSSPVIWIWDLYTD
jgi:hypothetical protein